MTPRLSSAYACRNSNANNSQPPLQRQAQNAPCALLPCSCTPSAAAQNQPEASRVRPWRVKTREQGKFPLSADVPPPFSAKGGEVLVAARHRRGLRPGRPSEQSLHLPTARTEFLCRLRAALSWSHNTPFQQSSGCGTLLSDGLARERSTLKAWSTESHRQCAVHLSRGMSITLLL